MPTRKYNNQNWLPSIFNDFFDSVLSLGGKRIRPVLMLLSYQLYKENCG